MTTITIDIPEKETEAVIAILKKHGVKVRKASLARLDKLGAEDYRKHFSNQTKTAEGLIKNRL